MSRELTSSVLAFASLRLRQKRLYLYKYHWMSDYISIPRLSLSAGSLAKAGANSCLSPRPGHTDQPTLILNIFFATSSLYMFPTCHTYMYRCFCIHVFMCHTAVRPHKKHMLASGCSRCPPGTLNGCLRPCESSLAS